MTSHKKLEHWKSVFRSQRESGLTVAIFCKQQKVNLSTYYAWRKKLNLGNQKPTKKSHQLVPLFVNEPETKYSSQLLITTPRNYQLAFDESLPIEKIHQILRLIE